MKIKLPSGICWHATRRERGPKSVRGLKGNGKQNKRYWIKRRSSKKSSPELE